MLTCLFLLFVAYDLFLFFAPSVAGGAAVATAVEAGQPYCNCCCWSCWAAESALQYLQGAGIRTRDSATADRCATCVKLLLYENRTRSSYNNCRTCGQGWPTMVFFGLPIRAVLIDCLLSRLPWTKRISEIKYRLTNIILWKIMCKTKRRDNQIK